MNNAPVDAVAPANGTAAPKGSRRLLVVGVLGLLVVAGLGAGVWFFLARGNAARVATAVAVEPELKATVPLGAVVVNLNGEARRYLRVGVSLGVPKPGDAREVEDHKSQLLDLFIAVLSAAPPDSLTSADGKAAVKQTLLARIREDLRLTKVGRVYFTEFVIQ